MRLLLDEMWDQEIAVQLRLRGHDVVSVRERAELRAMNDEVVFATSQEEERALVTENVVDFRPIARRRIHRRGSHCGLIFTSNRSFPRHRPGTLGRVVAALDALLTAGSDLTNQEIWIR